MTEPSPPDAARLAELIVHLGRAAGAAGAEGGPLTAAQWSALRYFAAANARSRTPSAFARFHGATRGTASQTVLALARAGLVARRASEADGRSARFDPTERGLAALAADPIGRLAAAVAALPDPLREGLRAAALRLAAAVGAARGDGGFGQCPDCAHCVCGGDDARWCDRHRRALAPPDLGLLCADFRLRADGAEVRA
jgi:DNA-binding MarR family transcriptional regulator